MTHFAVDFPAHVALSNGWDLVETGYCFPGHAAVYLCSSAGRVAICDAGIGASTPQVMATLAQLAYPPEAVDYLFISHAHLDHCAGAGHLMESLPNATLICHARAQAHLADPARLLAGARSLYAAEFDELYGEVRAVAAPRITTAADGATYPLGERTLEVIHTPGHTFDHVSVVDRAGDTVFTGDAFGVAMAPEYGLPTLARIPAAPTQFAPTQWRATVTRIAELGLSRVLQTHYGPLAGPVADRAAELIADLDAFVEFARTVRDATDPVATLRELLLQRWVGLWGQPPAKIELIDVDLLLSSRGIALWMNKHLDNYDAAQT